MPNTPLNKELYDKRKQILLGFYSVITGNDYEWAVQEYLGRHPDKYGIVQNKLYAAVETAIQMLNEETVDYDAAVREARIESLKSILVAYQQTTGIDIDLFVSWIQDEISRLITNPLDLLVLPSNDNGKTYSKDELEAAVKDARKKAYSRGFDTAKTVYVKKLQSQPNAKEEE